MPAPLTAAPVRSASAPPVMQRGRRRASGEARCGMSCSQRYHDATSMASLPSAHCIFQLCGVAFIALGVSAENVKSRHSCENVNSSPYQWALRAKAVCDRWSSEPQLRQSRRRQTHVPLVEHGVLAGVGAHWASWKCNVACEWVASAGVYSPGGVGLAVSCLATVAATRCGFASGDPVRVDQRRQCDAGPDVRGLRRSTDCLPLSLAGHVPGSPEPAREPPI